MNEQKIRKKTSPKIAIIILNWNGWEDTIECLESLYQITYPNFDVIVIDNASQDFSIEKIKRYAKGDIPVYSPFFTYLDNNKPITIIEYSEDQINYPNCKNVYYENLQSNKKLILIKNTKNYGYAGGNNIGIQYVLKNINYDFILLLNNDTVVEKNFLEELVLEGQKNKEIGLLNPLIFNYDEPSQIQYYSQKINFFIGTINTVQKKDFDKFDTVDTDIACGACLLIKKETLDKIGLIPTDYFMLWEDIDYSTRAINHGLRCVYVTKSKIWHKGSISIGKISSPMRIRYSMRNRFIFWKRFSSQIQYYFFLFFTIVIHGPTLLSFGLAKTKTRKKFIKEFFRGFLEGIF